MSEHLCIRVRFLDGAFHGRGDGGTPEWPPSPLRLFQALVAASAARWNERRGITHAAPALRWLESLPPPTIVAPQAATGAAYRLYVPDNVGDLVGKSWARGNEASMAEYRTEKTVRPTHVADDALCYLWHLPEGDEAAKAHCNTLMTAARSITHLGWGVDLVVADAALMTNETIRSLPGQRWHPSVEGSTSLRVPHPGTLVDLERRHTAFLQRVNGETFSPVPPLGEFHSISYCSDSEPPRAPWSVFALRQIDDSAFRPFDPVRQSLHVAGMIRHVTGREEIARRLGWTSAHVAKFVHGHQKLSDVQPPGAGARLLFLPLPSIEPRSDRGILTVGSVRRVLVTVFGGTDREEFRRLSQSLAGQELIDEKTGSATALLSKLPESDGVTQRHYLKPAATWASVTPVVLPGYDDPRKLRQRLRPENAAKLTREEKTALLAKLDKRIDLLLRKAIRQAGYSEQLAAHAEIEWRASGYWTGTALASQYAAGDQHRRFRKLHIRLTWRDASGNTLEIPGPICLGSGKFSGMGLFAAVHS